MNYLGVDWGKSKLGLALGSDETKIASPIMILSFNSYKEVVSKLKEIIIEEKIEKVIVGEPVTLAGDETKSDDYKKFIKLLGKIENIEIDFEDERLSTKLAEKLNREFKGYKKVGDDDMAAAAILQTYFDRL